jgi:hypothetical protein
MKHQNKNKEEEVEEERKYSVHMIMKKPINQ